MLWSPLFRRFSVITLLISSYFIDNILIPLSEKKALIWNGSSKKKVWLQLDNSMVHNSKTVMPKYDHFGFKRPPHHPYFSYLAPSDYLEEKLKGKLFRINKEKQFLSTG